MKLNSECETTADALEDQLHVQISSRLGESDSISSLSVTCSEKTTSIARKRRATTSYDAKLNLEITTLVTPEPVTQETTDSTGDSSDDTTGDSTQSSSDQSTEKKDDSSSTSDSTSDSILSSVITDSNAISSLITESVADAVEESGQDDLAHLVVPTEPLQVTSVIAEPVTVVEEAVTEEPVVQGTFIELLNYGVFPT